MNTTSAAKVQVEVVAFIVFVVIVVAVLLDIHTARKRNQAAMALPPPVRQRQHAARASAIGLETSALYIIMTSALWYEYDVERALVVACLLRLVLNAVGRAKLDTPDAGR